MYILDYVGLLKKQA